MKIKLEEMTLKEVKEQGEIEVAVLPWGSCEPHNLHLPYGCDAIVTEKVAQISAEKAIKKGAKLVVLPAIPIGVNSNLFGFPLTLHLSPTTQLAILKDILRSLEAHRIYKLVLLNGHGGNEFGPLMREVYGTTKVFIFLFNYWSAMNDIIEDVCDDRTGEHGNESETSLCMALFPELVHLEWADAGKTKEPVLEGLRNGWLKIIRPWHLLTTNSGYGNPEKATKEKGEKMLEQFTDRIASVFLEISKARIDKTFPY